MQKKMQWDLTRLALQAARRILFRRWKFRWSEALANFSVRWTVVGGARVVRGAQKKYLIEVAPFGRLDQMLFFSAPLTTRAPPTIKLTVRPDVRLGVQPRDNRGRILK